ncbi:hypothetical protein NL676_016649 [Syzygium grande]|nr:hypothetical protein NL676_016649 [Syzygium grande]
MYVTRMSNSNLPCSGDGFFILIVLHLLGQSVLSISFNKTHFYPGGADMIYEGDAMASSGAIHLNIVNYQFRVGHATFTEPVQLWDSSTGRATDFTTHFSLTIDTLNSTLCSDGIAFFLAPVGFPIPPN